MFGLIGSLFGALGFLGNILLLIILYVFIKKALSNFLYTLFLEVIIRPYRKLRTKYYILRVHYNPNNAVLHDKCRRSIMHLNILGMQSYLLYLMHLYASFEICEKCHFPNKPDAYSCDKCGYTSEEHFQQALTILKTGI